MVDPAGPAAQAIAQLWWTMLAGAAAILCFVMVLLVLSFRSRRIEVQEDKQIRVWIIALGLTFPMTVLAALLAFGLVIGDRLLPQDGPRVVQVFAEGHRWFWQFTYDDIPEFATRNTLHIPAGRAVDVAITTTDVIHSFWVPRLAGKMDAIPGHTNVLRIMADEPGTYQGLSAEFSGTGYSAFRFTVTAHDAAGWDAFVRGDQP